MLILFLIKKFKRTSLLSRTVVAMRRFATNLTICFSLFLVSGSFANDLNTPVESISFNIFKGEDVIGQIAIEKTESDSSVIYNLISSITTKILLPIKLVGREKSVFNNGILVYSSVYRKLNDKVKTDQVLKYTDGLYILDASNRNRKLKVGLIKKNLISLYYAEPIGVSQIFCDNLHRNVPVLKLSEGVYKVQFTNSNYNIFHYNGGRCIKVVAVSALFSVTLIPQ